MEIPEGLKLIQSWESTIKPLAERLADLLLGEEKGTILTASLHAIATLLKAKIAGDLAET